MNKNRLEAFSDGVLAIIITIMVLEFKVPEGTDFDALVPLMPKFLSYVLSFIYLAIYWNNHHHLMHTVKRVNGKIQWANMHLLFWLSLIPFVTAWNGNSHFASFTMMVYGFVLLMCGFSYSILQHLIIQNQGNDMRLANAIGKDIKGNLSLILYIVAILLANFSTVLAGIIFIIVALMWLVPDKRIERLFNEKE
jgi:uncharacterized membrane protein